MKFKIGDVIKDQAGGFGKKHWTVMGILGTHDAPFYKLSTIFKLKTGEREKTLLLSTTLVDLDFISARREK